MKKTVKISLIFWLYTVVFAEILLVLNPEEEGFEDEGNDDGHDDHGEDIEAHEEEP